MIEVSIIGEYLTQWDKNRYIKIVTDEAMENLTVNAASFLDTTVMSFTVEKESDGFYTAKIPDSLLEDDTYLLVWISNGDYIVSEKFKFPIEHKPKEETEDVEDGLLSENGDLLNTENGKAILVETGNSIKISNLPITETLTDDSVFPVVQDGETKKVAYRALKGGFTGETVTTEITIGDTVTLDAGEQANVENVGTPTRPVLKFYIPKGDKGEQGIQGLQGIKGEKGDKGDPGDSTGSGGTSTGGFMVAPNAGSHNALYRGKYLGDTVTEEQYAQIASGTFDDLFIGDYWTINNINWRIASFDYYLNVGDTPCTNHHAVIVPDECLYSDWFHKDSNYSRAYINTYMYTNGLEQAETIIKDAFSGHVLNHRLLLVSNVKDGMPYGVGWYNSEVELMNEYMVYGNTVMRGIATGIPHIYNKQADKTQLQLFAYEPNRICNGKSWWLRDLSLDIKYSCVKADGSADCAIMDIIPFLWIRPFFCIY